MWNSQRLDGGHLLRRLPGRDWPAPGRQRRGYRADVVDAAERHHAAFTVTARQFTNVRSAIETLVPGFRS